MAQFPFQNPDLPISERVEDLIGRMTLEEKVGQMVNNAPAIDRLGVPAYDWWNEGLHGVGRAGNATVFPQAIGLAATWNKELMHRVATAISDEARAKHHAALRQNNHTIYTGLTYWSPNINILRDPRWGRAQETYGEDPVLTAEMGVAFVKGMQGNDPKHLKLVATPKHYAVHSGPEKGRAAFDIHPSPKDFWETYLPAFEECIVDGGALSIMGAYNRLYGDPCNASRLLLTDILRDRWGFRGFVVSDCGAIENIVHHHKTAKTMAEAAAQSVKAGCDLACGCAYTALKEAVHEGLITEAEIDTSLRRLFEARFRLGMFDPEEKVRFASIPESEVGCETHRKLARQAAVESIVLLKNKNGILPLKKEHNELFVTGPCAASLEVLWGNYNGFSSTMATLLEGIVGAVSAGTKISYAPGCALSGPAAKDYPGVAWEMDKSDVVIACMGIAPSLEGEEGDAALLDSGGDRLLVGLPESQTAYLDYLKAQAKPIILVLTGGSPIEIAKEADWADAVLFVWYPGCEGGHAVADVLFGNANPGGRLPATFPASASDLPPFEDYSMAGRTYRFATAKPAFGFGEGLSYTRFGFSNAEARSNPDGSLTVEVDVANLGNWDGSEVVQVYLRDAQPEAGRPLHWLAAFDRLAIKAGNTVRAKLLVKGRRLDRVEADGSRRRISGPIRVFVGGGQPTNERVASGEGLETTVQI